MSSIGRDPARLLHAAFEIGRDAVLVFDRERTVVHANASARRLFAEDIVGLSPARRAERWTFRDEAGRLMPAATSPSARGLRGETVRDVRCELIAEDGRRCFVSVDADPVRDAAGSIEGVVCVLRETDIVEHARPRLFEGQPSWIGAATRGGSAAERLRVVADAGRALVTSPDDTATLTLLARAAVPALADWCIIRVIEADGQMRRLPMIYADAARAEIARAMDEYYATHTDVIAPVSGVARVLRTGESVLIPHVSAEWLRRIAHDEAHLGLLQRMGVASVLHAPLLLRGQTVGVMTLLRTGSSPAYRAADLAVAEELCDRAAVAIEHARLVEASERRAREGHAMADIARVLAETLDPSLVWQRIAAGVRTLLDDAPSAALYQLESAGDMRAVAVSTESGVHFDWTRRLPKGTGMVGLAIRNRAVVASPDVLDDPEVVYPPDVQGRLERSAYRALLAVPLIVQERVLGALAVGAHGGRRFTEREIELVSAFAYHAAVAIDNARLFAEAQRRRADAESARVAAENANRAKDEFLAVLSHELRTPLTAILGWVRLLLTGRLPATRVTEALTAIHRNTRLQTRLIDDLLDTSRIVAGKIQLELRPIDLAAVVHEVLSVARQDPRAAALLAPAAIEPGCMVRGDRDRLHQVVMNLVGNALKFTPTGGRVDVRLAHADGAVELVVSDTGEGIAADELAHVFDRFHQVDRSHTRRHGGLGLGLAIVRHLVEAHSGTVRAESAGRGRGASFTVRLPDVRDTGAVTAVAPAIPATAERLLTDLAVLFGDDNAEARALVSTVLEGAGAAVSVAASAADALAILQDQHVDVVLTDIGMPGLDGYDFVMRLREIERAAGRSPVCAIALTAHAGAEDRRRALTGGFQGYLAKPIDPDELVRATYAVHLEASRR
jgi:signal transduction histidine kinase/ActR/RegA family two-component response regulator